MPRGRAPSREGGEGNVGSGVTGVKEGGDGAGATGAGVSDDTRLSGGGVGLWGGGGEWN